MTTEPTVLSIAGHDPTGGAGIQADIEAIAAQGAYPVSLVTALTVQDTSNVRQVQPVSSDLLAEQADCLLADCRISAVKLGLLGDVSQLHVIARLLRRLGVPSVLDPILRAGGGKDLLSQGLMTAMREQLLPLATIVLPNAAEARCLTGEGDVFAAGQSLIRLGALNVLITGGDEPSEQVRNIWFRTDAEPKSYLWPRIEGGFHGAGCTLASALAARLAWGDSMETALEVAQAYTHQCLLRSRRPGRGRSIPGRWPVPTP